MWREPQLLKNLKILVDGKLRGGAVSILVLLLLKLCCKGRGWKNLNAHHHSQRKRWGDLLWEWANSSRGADYPGSYPWSHIRDKISCLMPILYKNIGREWLLLSLNYTTKVDWVAALNFPWLFCNASVFFSTWLCGTTLLKRVEYVSLPDQRWAWPCDLWRPVGGWWSESGQFGAKALRSMMCFFSFSCGLVQLPWAKLMIRYWSKENERHRELTCT